MKRNRALYWLRYGFAAFGLFAAAYLAGSWFLAAMDPARCPPL